MKSYYFPVVIFVLTVCSFVVNGQNYSVRRRGFSRRKTKKFCFKKFIRSEGRYFVSNKIAC